MALLYLLLPFAAQVIAMGIDEFYFHRRRFMPRWERLGHPLDTLLLLACLAIPLSVAITVTAFRIYVALAFLSCLAVTKDEWVHKQHCLAGEQWLHAVQFMLHPLTLLSTAVLWYVASLDHSLPGLAIKPFLGFGGSGASCHLLLTLQFLLTSGFLVYQVVYWNIYPPRSWKSQP